MEDVKELFSKKIGKILELCEVAGVNLATKNRIRKQIWYLYDDINERQDGKDDGETYEKRC